MPFALGVAVLLTLIAACSRSTPTVTVEPPEHSAAVEAPEIAPDPSSDEAQPPWDLEVGLASVISPACIDDALRSLVPHRMRRPDPSLMQALRRSYCSVRVWLPSATDGDLAFSERDFRMRLDDAAFVQMPYDVDSNSPAVWDADNALYVFNSSWQQTYRGFSDTGVENLASPVPVQLPATERPGTAWIEALWRDPDDGTLYGWYHLEPSDLPCLTAPVIGAAVSYDNGLTWEDRGTVLENRYAADCGYDNGYFVGGNGDFSVIVGPDDRYFYFLFSNYAGPSDEQGVAVARSAYVDRGQPGTTFKYHRGAWDEPGGGGSVSAILPSSTGWAGPHVEAFWGPSVHWNSFLQVYVVLLNHTDGLWWEQEGVYVSFTHDLLNWTKPAKILESPDWYPQVLGLDEGGTDSLAGASMRLYVRGNSTLTLEFESP